MIYINSTSILSILNYEYISAILLLIYVGAISILILFIIMMYQINETEMDHTYNKYLVKRNILYTSICTFFLLHIIDQIIVLYHAQIQYTYASISNITNEPLFSTYNEYISKYLGIFSNINNISDLIYTYYMYPLLLAAFFLFFVVIISINLILKHIG
jgi:NADH-quinone oxidoreductase subunit J